MKRTLFFAVAALLATSALTAERHRDNKGAFPSYKVEAKEKRRRQMQKATDFPKDKKATQEQEWDNEDAMNLNDNQDNQGIMEDIEEFFTGENGENQALATDQDQDIPEVDDQWGDNGNAFGLGNNQNNQGFGDNNELWTEEIPGDQWPPIVE